MKLATLFFLITIIFIPSCDTIESDGGGWTKGKIITSSDDSKIPDSIKKVLKIDAATLALRDVVKDPESKFILVEIPPDLIELYYRGLVLIYNAIKYPPYNRINAIHVFPNPPVVGIMVLIDTTYEWTKSWKRGERLTGNVEIDFLMEKYDLQLNSCYYDLAAIYSLQPFNTYALSNKFLGIQGIRISEPNGYLGDGADIKAEILDPHILYVFSFGWGDCPSGCINRHYWDVTVRYNGSVIFLREYGDPLP